MNGKWFQIKMRQMIRGFYGDTAVNKLRVKNWLWRFISRNGITLRCKTNKKKLGNSEKLPIIQKFHQQLKRDVKSRRRCDGLVTYDSKWGCWTQELRYDVDQVPCPFIIDQEITYEQKGYVKCLDITTRKWLGQATMYTSTHHMS